MAYWQHVVEKENREEARRDFRNLTERAQRATQEATRQGKEDLTIAVADALKSASADSQDTLEREVLKLEDMLKSSAG